MPSGCQLMHSPKTETFLHSFEKNKMDCEVNGVIKLIFFSNFKINSTKVKAF